MPPGAQATAEEGMKEETARETASLGGAERCPRWPRSERGRSPSLDKGHGCEPAVAVRACRRRAVLAHAPGRLEECLSVMDREVECNRF